MPASRVSAVLRTICALLSEEQNPCAKSRSSNRSGPRVSHWTDSAVVCAGAVLAPTGVLLLLGPRQQRGGTMGGAVQWEGSEEEGLLASLSSSPCLRLGQQLTATEVVSHYRAGISCESCCNYKSRQAGRGGCPGRE